MTRPDLRPAMLGALLLFGACSAQETTRTGFLAPGAAPLVADATDPGTLAYAAPPSRLAGYRAVLIEDVAFRPGPGAPASADPEVVADLRQSYRAALAEAFAERGYRVGATPMPGTLRVRAAITGYERANVPLNIATTLLVFLPVTAGGAASEAEVTDAGSGERLVALATHSNATPFLGSPLNYFAEHGHARAALARHARALAERVPMAASLVSSTR